MSDFLNDSLGLTALVMNSNKLALDFANNLQFDSALHLLHKAHTKLESSSDIKLKAMTLNNLGCLYKRIEQFERAAFFLSEALHMTNDPVTLASTHLNLCAVYSHINSHDTALMHAMNALNALRETRDLTGNKATALIIAFHNAGVEYEFMGKLREAAGLYYEGWEYAVEHAGRSHDLTLKMHSAYESIYHRLTRPRFRFHKTPVQMRTKPAKDLLTFIGSNKRKDRSITTIKNYEVSSPMLRGLNMSPHRLPTLKPIHRNIDNLGEQMTSLHNRIDMFEREMFSEETERPLLNSRENMEFYSKRRQKAAALIQKVFRLRLKKKHIENNSLKATAIQKIYRKWKAKRQLRIAIKNRERIATKMQAVARMFLMKMVKIEFVDNLFRQSKIIQTQLRCCFAVIKVQDIRDAKTKSSMSIQKLRRGFTARTFYKKVLVQHHKLSLIIQTVFRKALAKENVTDLRILLTEYQIYASRYYRGFIARRFVRNKRKNIHKNSLIIQIKFKQMLSREGQLKNFYERSRACQVIQKHYRGWKGWLKFGDYFRKIRFISILIQTGIRAKYARAIYFQEKMIKNRSSITIQSKFRRMKTIKRFNEFKSTLNASSLVIQRVFRTVMSKDFLKLLRSNKNRAALYIQKSYRGLTGRRTLRNFSMLTGNNGLIIQKRAKQFLAHSFYKGLFYQRSSSAIMIQKFYKSYRTHKEYKRMVNAALVIQAYFRKYIEERPKTELSLPSISVPSISSTPSLPAFVCENCCYKFELFSICELLKSPYISPSLYDKREQIYLSILTIQKNIKGFLTRNKYPLRHVIRIQSAFRTFRGKKICDKIRNVLRIQSEFKRYIARISYEEYLKHVRTQRASLIIQSKFREFLGRTEYEQYLDAAITEECVSNLRILFKNNLSKLIQIQLSELKRTRAAVVMIQSEFRKYMGTLAHLNQIEIVKIDKSTLKIQTEFRGFLAKLGFYELQSIVKIQSAWKMHLAIETAREEYINLETYIKFKSALLIQSHFKRYATQKVYNGMREAAIVLQKTSKMMRVRNIYRSIKNAVIFIQDFYRFSVFKSSRNSFVHHSRRVLMNRRVY